MTDTVSHLPLRVGVVGYGFGQFHVKSLAHLPGVELVAVADRRSAQLGVDAKLYGFAPYRDALAMIDEQRLDVLTVAISPKHRASLIKYALDQGLALFIEKPWASNREHARQLAGFCQSAARRVMPGFSFRFHPAIARLKSLLGDHAEGLGRPNLLHAQYVFGWLPPVESWTWDEKNGNGFLNENSCHLFDSVCHLMGRPIRVYAEGGRSAGRPMEDSAAITLRFEQGGIASLACGGLGVSGGGGGLAEFPSLSLFAQRGQAELRGRNHVWESLRWATHDDPATRVLVAPPEQLGTTRYTHAFEHFFDCLRYNRPPTATLDHAVRSVDVAMAVIESARQHRPVEL